MKLLWYSISVNDSPGLAILRSSRLDIGVSPRSPTPGCRFSWFFCNQEAGDSILFLGAGMGAGPSYRFLVHLGTSTAVCGASAVVWETSSKSHFRYSNLIRIIEHLAIGKGHSQDAPTDPYFLGCVCNSF